MSNRTYVTGPCGHRVFFDPTINDLRTLWCNKCEKTFKLDSRERRLVLVAYRYGREIGKQEVKTNVRNALGLFH
jgi:DNA-directed RNA polymerase subunit RPC12/RpoP